MNADMFETMRKIAVKGFIVGGPYFIDTDGTGRFKTFHAFSTLGEAFSWTQTMPTNDGCEPRFIDELGRIFELTCKS